MDFGAVIILAVFAGVAGGVVYLFAGQFVTARYVKPSARRRDRRHKPLD